MSKLIILLQLVQVPIHSGLVVIHSGLVVIHSGLVVIHSGLVVIHSGLVVTFVISQVLYFLFLIKHLSLHKYVFMTLLSNFAREHKIMQT